MSTRARSLSRLILVAGVVACFAALAGVARAGLPGTSTSQLPDTSAATAPALPQATSSTQTEAAPVTQDVQETAASLTSGGPVQKASNSLPTQPTPANSEPLAQTASKSAPAAVDASVQAATATVTQTTKTATTVTQPMESMASPIVETAKTVTPVLRITPSTSRLTARVSDTVTNVLRVAATVAAPSGSSLLGGTPSIFGGPLRAAPADSAQGTTRAGAAPRPSAAPASSQSSAPKVSASETLPRSPASVPLGGGLPVNGKTTTTGNGEGRFRSGLRSPLSLTTTNAMNEPTAPNQSGSSRSPVPDLPRLPVPGFTQAGAGATGFGGGLLAFAVLLFGFLLVIPNAVRWLRAALALGLSPAYVAIGDRPG